MESFFRPFRHKVSADKNRYQTGDYDLDLTYVSDRVIAMAFPAEGVESAFRNNIMQVSRLLKEKHDSYFMLYNLSNRPYDSSKFDERVYNWCGFMDHYPPPLVLLWRILHSMHAWLKLDERNVCAVHCLAGKGRTGTIIASFFVFCGLFDNIRDALNFFAYRRSHNSWGVTGPSQLRYCDYAEKVIKENFVPKLEPIVLSVITLENLPRLNIGPGEKGCAPFFEIYTYDSSKHLIFSSEHMGEEIRQFPCSKKKASFYIDVPMRNDILIQFKHVTPLFSTEPMFHLCFHTGMIENYQLVIPRSGIEKAFKDSRYPDNFTLTLTFEPLKDASRYVVDSADLAEEKRLWNKRLSDDEPHLDGRLCFNGNVELKMALGRDIGSPTRGNVCVKGGFLTKQGHKIKNWKRRWFVLKGNTLSYYKAPRDSKAVGVIPVSVIKEVRYCDGPVDEFYNVFQIVTQKNYYLISAGTVREMKEWAEAIVYARGLQFGQGLGRRKIGSIVLKVDAVAGIAFAGEVCTTFVLDAQRYTATALPNAITASTVKGAPPTVHFNDNIAFVVGDEDLVLSIYVWESSGADEPDQLIGKVHIPIKYIQQHQRMENWFSLNSPDPDDVVPSVMPSYPKRTSSLNERPTSPTRSPYAPSSSLKRGSRAKTVAASATEATQQNSDTAAAITFRSARDTVYCSTKNLDPADSRARSYSDDGQLPDVGKPSRRHTMWISATTPNPSHAADGDDPNREPSIGDASTEVRSSSSLDEDCDFTDSGFSSTNSSSSPGSVPNAKRDTNPLKTDEVFVGPHRSEVGVMSHHLSKSSDLHRPKAHPAITSSADAIVNRVETPIESNSSASSSDSTSVAAAMSESLPPSLVSISKVGLKSTQVKRQDMVYIPRIRLVLEYIESFEEKGPKSSFLSEQINSIKNLLVDTNDSAFTRSLTNAPLPAATRGLQSLQNISTSSPDMQWLNDRKMLTGKAAHSASEQIGSVHMINKRVDRSVESTSYNRSLSGSKMLSPLDHMSPEERKNSRPFSWDGGAIDYRSAAPKHSQQFPAPPPDHPAPMPPPPVNPAPPPPLCGDLPSSWQAKSPTHTISLVRKFPVTDATPVAVVVVNDEMVWMCDSEATIHVINVQTAKINLVMRGNKTTGQLRCLTLFRDTVWSGGDGGITVWDAMKFRPIRKLKRHKAPVDCLLYTKTTEGEFIWSSSGDASADKGTIIVWNASTFECKKQFQIENSKVQCLAKHRDTVWVGTSDFVLAFDSNTLQVQKQIRIGAGRISFVVGAHNHLWIGSKDSHQLYVWDWTTGTCVKTLSIHKDNITSVERVAGHIWSTSTDGEVIVWEPEGVRIKARLYAADNESALITKYCGADFFLYASSQGSLVIYRFRG